MTHGNQHLVVDWPVLLEELHLAGQSFRCIASQVDVSHVTLINYANQAASPLHATGERLVAYWSLTTGKQRHQLPMTQVVKRITSLSA